MNTQLVAGSIGAIARQENKSIAETFLSCDVIVIVDTSGSMSANDSRDNKSRYTVACEELAQLQANLPGKIAVIAFSNEVAFCPSGIPTNYGGGTELATALQFTKVADNIPSMRFILISDGEPHNEQTAMAVARTYKNKIDVIYVGPDDRPSGRTFLMRLADATGGQSVTSACAKELTSKIENLLLTA